eukprot:GEMP01086199.1.p1 GENE.GEMP01086199.1~~GEMP01086199.1.p1  ORF type:complete len:106 (+),score=26.24 GEMP01086199.1:192-509(+)
MELFPRRTSASAKYAPRAITWNIFLEVAIDRLSDGNAADSLIAAFRVFDKENTGSVSIKNLRHVITTVGDKMSGPEFDEILRAALLDSQSEIHYESFVRMMVAQR